MYTSGIFNTVVFLQINKEYPEYPIFLHESGNILHTVSKSHSRPTTELFACETQKVYSGHQDSISSCYLRSKTVGYLESINSDHLTPNNSEYLQPIESISHTASKKLSSSKIFNTFNTFLKCKRNLKGEYARKNLNFTSEIDQHNAPSELCSIDNALNDVRRTGDNMNSSCHKFLR